MALHIHAFGPGTSQDSYSSKITEFALEFAQKSHQGKEELLKGKINFETVSKTGSSFVIKGVGIILTKEGELLYEYAKYVIHNDYLVEQQIKDLNKGICGELRIGTTSGTLNFWLAKDAAQFSLKYPDLRIKFYTDDYGYDYKEHMVDAFISGFLDNRLDLEQNLIRQYHHCLCASQEYLNKYGVPQNIEDLDQHRLISFSTEDPHILGDVHWHLTSGRDPSNPRKPYLEVSSTIGLLEILRMDGGIGIFSKEFAPDLVEVLPQLEKRTVEFFYSYDYKLSQSQRVTAFYDFLKAKYNPV